MSFVFRDCGPSICGNFHLPVCSPISQMLRMIEVEIEELEIIQKELDNDAISIEDSNNRCHRRINLNCVLIGI